MRGRAVWTLLSAASVLLVSVVARAECTKDTDCKGDRVCDAGKCTSPAAALPPAPAAPPGSDAGATPTPGPEGAAATDGQAPAKPKDGTPAAAPATDLQVRPVAEGAAPEPLAPDEPKTRRRSRGAMVTGIAMASVGPIALLAALAAKNAQERCDDELQRDYPNHVLPTSERFRVDECNGYSVPLYVFGIGGALLTVAGVPLIIYGAKKVPDEASRVSLQVLPWAGPGSSGVKLRLTL